MLENEAKGWKGNYSIIGRNLIERFHLLKKKDEILSGKMKKVYVSEFIFPDELNSSDEEKKNKDKKGIDIFSETYEKLKKEKLKLKNEEKKLKQAELCTSKAKCDIKEKYKYHQFHHSDLNIYNDKLIKFIKNKSKCLANYNPKMHFIWKKTVSGPQWELLRGRVKNKNNKNSGEDVGFYLNHEIILSNAVTMEKQTRRGIIPISYDLRIRTDKPFIPKVKISRNNKNKNNTNNSNIDNLISETINDNNIKNKNNSNLIKSKFPKTPNKSKLFITTEKSNNLNTFSNFNYSKFQNILEQDSNSSIKKSKNYKMNLKQLNIPKKLDSNGIYFSPSKTNYKKELTHTIDFSKTLPRNTNIFLHKKDEYDHPLSIPSYKLIEPRCITMVSYSKKKKGKSSPRKFEGLDPNIFFDPDKVINKVNNHKEVTSPNFEIMTGRIYDSGPLPSFMVNLFDRKSLDMMTYKGLEMNNYANVGFKTNYSSFQSKKSFNKSLNNSLLNNEEEEAVDEELKKINKEIYGDKNWEKKLEEFSIEENRSKDYKSSYYDYINSKTLKRNRREKKIWNKPLEFRF